MSRDDQDGGTQYHGPDALKFSYPEGGLTVSVSPAQHRRLWQHWYPDNAYVAGHDRPQPAPEDTSTGTLRIVTDSEPESWAEAALIQNARHIARKIMDANTYIKEAEADLDKKRRELVELREQQTDYQNAIAALHRIGYRGNHAGS